MGHFYKLLCEEMIFLLHKGKNDGLGYEVIIEISIYSRAGFFIYFMQIPAFYVFCRKSSNIFEKNLRTRGFIRKSLYKIFEQINEKFRAGINGYFCIKKILHFNGNEMLYFVQTTEFRSKDGIDMYKSISQLSAQNSKIDQENNS